MKLKSDCCEKYQRKDKVCKECPLLAALSKKKRKRKLKKILRELRRTA